MKRRAVAGIAAALAAGTTVALAVFALAPVFPVPGYDAVRGAWRPSEATLRDRNGELLQQLRVDMTERRLDWIPLDAVSPALVRAVVRAEDKRFESHGGVDWVAAGAAALETIAGARRGASTVTMQLAALLGEPHAPGNGRRSVAQKIAQMRAALALERRWSKRQILEAYVNLLPYRGELRGIGAAARGLFGKHPSGLDQAEALLLAALIPSPNAGAGRVAARACAIARAGGFATSCARLRHLAASSFAAPPDIAPAASTAPHLAHELLHGPGESVTTTLDAWLQRFAVDALERQVKGLDGQNVRDAAAIVVDNASGEVLAYVGSSGASSRAPQVDGVRAARQAGSTLKPFLYGLALERGYLTAASLIDDSPLNIATPVGLYIPQNYDRDFKGLVSVRTALASSLNVPAVRTLVLTGLEDFHGRLRRLGYAHLDHDAEHYGYSLALGSAEVSLREQVNAYRTLANGGVWSPLRFTRSDPATPRRRVMSRAAAFIVADMLSDRAARSLTFGLANSLATRYWSAVKTGTSKNMRDNWCVGFSHAYTVAVWVGNFEGDPMWDVSGVTGAAPLWQEIMDALHAARPNRSPRPPLGAVARRVRFDPPVEPARDEWFVAGTETNVVRLVPPQALPARIRYPANGTILAVDPDMPPARQAVVLQAQVPARPVRWTLDGADLGPAGEPVLWAPIPGRHRLALVDSDGRRLDEVHFQVRGGAVTPQ